MSEVIEFPDRGFALADGVPKRFHGHVAAYLVAVFEAVDNRLRGVGNANRDALQDVVLNAFCQGLAGESNNA
jgi:hypothetical protein